ncbi:hypothetical protein BB561_002645 [Smittium simulii]|uniref:Arrestin-like N-terminal domain-containing protein n=1 Tax=Smittium simulii TaxID=133385 RepID=A0A2T9YPK6_9FUNG|nr:hypothetical protein BB561_002645 [Smittium simulii]
MNTLSELTSKNLSSINLNIILPEKNKPLFYGPDSKINAYLWLTLTKKTCIQRVCVQFTCTETTFINNNRSLLSKNKRVDRELFCVESNLWQLLSDKNPLPPGTYIFPFSLYIPRINLPNTCQYLGIYKLNYELKAFVDKSSSFSFKDRVVKRIDLHFSGKYFPTCAPKELLFEQTVDDSLNMFKVEFKGSINATEFLPDSTYKMKLEVKCPNNEYYIKNIKVFLHEYISIKTVSQGVESFSEYCKTLSKIDVPSYSIASESKNARSSTFESSFFDVRIPHDIADSNSGSAEITHAMVIIAKLKPKNEKFDKLIFSSVVKSEPHVSKLRLGIPIVHVDPILFSPSTFLNAFSDKKLNISSLSIPKSIESAKLPIITLNLEEKVKFIPWDEFHPLWAAVSTS